MTTLKSAATCDKTNGNCPCREICPLTYTLEIIGGKWKIPILCSLYVDGPIRYNELKRKINGISNTMLASSLKELENYGLVKRVLYDEMPVRVEYKTTDSVEKLIPILKQLASWGIKIHDAI